MRIIIFFILISFNSFCQDSIHAIVFKKEKATMFGVISVVMSPSIILATHSQKYNDLGKAFLVEFAIASVASGITCLVYSKKKNVFKYSLFSLAGITDAFGQELLFHYAKIKKDFPFLNDQFFDPSISWQNKYHSKIPWANGLFIGLTDGYHASRSINKGLVIGGILTFDRNINFKQQVKQVLICSFVYTLCKGGTHYLIND